MYSLTNVNNDGDDDDDDDGNSNSNSNSNSNNHKNYNFLDCDWLKKLLFSTNSLAKLLLDSLVSDSSIS